MVSSRLPKGEAKTNEPPMPKVIAGVIIAKKDGSVAVGQSQVPVGLPDMVGGIIDACQNAVAFALGARDCDPHTAELPEGYDLAKRVNAIYKEAILAIKPKDGGKYIDFQDVAKMAAILYRKTADIWDEAAVKLAEHAKTCGQHPHPDEKPTPKRRKKR